MKRTGVGILLLSIVGVVGCKKEAAEVPAAASPPVHVEPVRREPLVPSSESTAEVHAHRDAVLRAEAPGRVVATTCESGQEVREGDVLVRLDVGRTSVAIDAAGAQVAQAEARLSQAERQRDTAARLVQTGGMPQQTLDDAEDGVRLASAALEAARAQTRVTRRGLTEAIVRAPFSGTVATCLTEVGEYVGPGTPIAQVVDRSHLEADVLLDPREALDVRPGAPVRVHVHSRPDEEFQGHVLRVGEVVDARTRRLPVEVEVLDPDGRLRPGLVARFEVVTGEPRSALVVESDAVFERFGRSQVYVVEDGVARRRSVTLGEVRTDRTEVIEGLREGEQVVVAGIDRVVDARPVNVVEQVAVDGSGATATTTTAAADAEPAPPAGETATR